MTELAPLWDVFLLSLIAGLGTGLDRLIAVMRKPGQRSFGFLMGIATALPLCTSGVCCWDSFRAALLSGLTEPIGAVIASLFLASFQSLIPGALAFAGGVMVFITLDKLIPTAREFGHQHTTAVGIILGSIFVFLLSGLMGV